MSVWDEIDKREERYREERTRTLEAIKELAHDRFDRHLSQEEIREWGQDPSSVGDVACGQDEFGWWRATVKIWVGYGAGGAVFRDLTYRARSSEGLVLAVRQRKEAA